MTLEISWYALGLSNPGNKCILCLYTVYMVYYRIYKCMMPLTIFAGLDAKFVNFTSRKPKPKSLKLLNFLAKKDASVAYVFLSIYLVTFLERHFFFSLHYITCIKI